MAGEQLTRPVNFKDVAEELLKNVKLFVMEDDNTFYIYDNGVYTSDGAEAKLNLKIRDLTDEMNGSRGAPLIPANRKFVAEVFDYIRIRRLVKRKDIGFNNNILNLRNGLLNVETMEFTEHTDGYYNIVQYPVKYDPAATCPGIEKFINEVVAPDDIDTLLEYSGYSLVPGNSLKVFAMLYGGRDAGKSTYCRLIESIVGAPNVAHVSPQSIQEDKFAKSRLYGKVLNTVPDIGDKPLSGTESIKSLVGNDEISADQKYKNPINFVNKSHTFFGANRVPDIKNDDMDFYDKVLMINFPHMFTGTKRDLGLADRLTTDNELSGFFNLLIAARKRLIERGAFTVSGTARNSRDVYRMQSNPINLFLDEHVISSEDNILKNVLHSHYVKWCRNMGVTAVADSVFGKKLKSLGYEDSQLRIGGIPKRFWLNIAYVDTKPTFQTLLVTKTSRDGNGQILPAYDMDTGEGDEEKSSMYQVSQAFSKTNSKEEDIIYSKRNLLQNTCYPVTGQPIAENRFIHVLQQNDGNSLLKKDIINHVKKTYPGYIIEDIPGAVDAFCLKYPGYAAEPGREYIINLFEMLKLRGWK